MKALKSLAAAALIAALFVSPALADVGPPFSAKAQAPSFAAKSGDLVEIDVEFRAFAPASLEDFRFESQSWRILANTAPTKLDVRAGDVVSFTISAIAENPDGVIQMSYVADGKVVEAGLQLPPFRDPNAPVFVAPEGVRDESREPLPEVAETEQVLAPWLSERELALIAKGQETQRKARESGKAIAYTISGRAFYNRSDGRVTGIDRPYVLLFEMNGGTVSQVLAQGYANQEGNYSFTFVWDSTTDVFPDLRAQHQMENEDVRAENMAGSRYVWDSSTFNEVILPIFSLGSWTHGTASVAPALHHYTHLTRSSRLLEGLGYPTSKLDLVAPSTNTTGAYYSPSLDEIHVGSNRLWNEDTAAHEFTHHFLYAYGNPGGTNYCNGICDSGGCGHCIWCQETEFTAFNEGMPNWIADYYTRLHFALYGYSTLNTRSQESLSTCSGSYDEPTLTEGFLGALLRDIEDGGQDIHVNGGLPIYPGGIDALSLGVDEILNCIALDDPNTPLTFLTKFAARYPQYIGPLNLTAINCGYQDLTRPTGPTAISSNSHAEGGPWSNDATVSVQWSGATDVWSGVNAYSVDWSKGLASIPDETSETSANSVTSSALSTGQWFVTVRPRDAVGNWSTQFDFATAGPFWVLGSDAPDLQPTKYAGWDHPGIVRSTADATTGSAPASPTLPGNTNGTYLTHRTQNTGGVATLGTGYVVHERIDGVTFRASGNGATPPGNWWYSMNQGPYTVRGGRHTHSIVTDVNDTEPEKDEGNNLWGRQWVWTPLDVSSGTTLTRSAPPVKTGGQSAIPAGSQTVYPNVDGLRLNTNGDYWHAVAIHPTSSTADFDVRMHAALSTGSTSGFETPDVQSTYGGASTDFVLMNRNRVGDSLYDVGVLNYDGDPSSYIVNVASSPVGDVLVLGRHSTFTLAQDEMIGLREMFTGAAEAGLGWAYVEVSPPQAGIELRWYDAETTLDNRSGSNSLVTTGPDGRASMALLSTVGSEYSMLMVTRDRNDGTGPIQVTLKLRTGVDVAVSGAPTGPLSVYSLPDGNGRPLTQAWSWSGVPGEPATTADASFGVTVTVSGSGAPQAGFPREDIRLVGTSGSLAACDLGNIADANTNGTSQTSFSGTLRAGGHSLPGEQLTVKVVDVPGQVGPAALNLRFNSADIDGNGIVDLNDVGTFATDLLGSYAYRSDFVWDGVIDLADIAELAIGLGTSCGPAKRSAVAKAGEAGADRMWISFDPEGTQRDVRAGAGEEVSAWLLLDGPSARKGVTAFAAALELSDNLELVSRTLGARGFELGENALEFVAGRDGEVHAVDGEPLVLATLRLRARDGQPGHVALRGVEVAAPGVDGPVIAAVDGGLAAVALDALDGDGVIATLNQGSENGTPEAELARGVQLRASPNPFNPATEIRFQLPHAGHTEVRIYDVAGRLVRTLGERELGAGPQSLHWNGTDDRGHGVVSGVYYARLHLDGQPLGGAQRMSLVK